MPYSLDIRHMGGVPEGVAILISGHKTRYVFDRLIHNAHKTNLKEDSMRLYLRYPMRA